ncbi:TBC1 domain family member 12 [Cephus cinctus]|uniref:TBC1 domain family member 12 n=1 Tax=Cephus cinctus TaxID=211228 RepID=A0AAJ7W7T3_CEPCN|nr:TBC1 domain family member 12 [Cephus cinctus]XP_024947005.1 TBC1 domain family member 12 [Cephus cinctus]
MKSPIAQHLNGDSSPPVTPQGAVPCLISCHADLANSFHVLKTGPRDPSGYLANSVATRIGKRQLVSLNGDSVHCNSVSMDEALESDVASVTTPKTKALCVHIRENKWYDAANTVISTGVSGTTLNHALESMSIAYDPSTKRIYSLDEVSINNGTHHIPMSESPESLEDPQMQSSSLIAKIDADECVNNNSTSVNNSPRSSLPRSCSSTVSSLSEVSPSGSLLGPDERQISPDKPKRWPLTTFFSKTFTWKQKESGQSTPASSPSRNVDKVGGSTALIQQPRPANLPAKSALEEERHRKQYNAILEAARKRELREEKERRQLREQQLKEEERLTEDSHTWNTLVLPRFEALKDTKKVRELWWRGLPPSIRGRVWKLAICNHLNITPNLYNLCLDRAMSNPTNESLTAIKLDVSRTFPTLCVFQEGGPLSKTLQDVLAAYSVYRPDVGYVQGMSFIGAVLSLNMDPADAFACFANLLNHPCHRAAFTLDQKSMNGYYKVYSDALAHRLPKVHAHFTTAGLSPDLYLLDWLYTIYAKAMPLDVACRVWDVFLRDGEEFLFRTALGVLHLYQEELLEMDFVRGAQFLTRLPENLQSEALFNSISQMSTTVGAATFQQMLARLDE